MRHGRAKTSGCPAWVPGASLLRASPQALNSYLLHSALLQTDPQTDRHPSCTPASSHSWRQWLHNSTGWEQRHSGAGKRGVKHKQERILGTATPAPWILSHSESQYERDGSAAPCKPTASSLQTHCQLAKRLDQTSVHQLFKLPVLFDRFPKHFLHQEYLLKILDAPETFAKLCLCRTTGSLQSTEQPFCR